MGYAVTQITGFVIIYTMGSIFGHSARPVSCHQSRLVSLNGATTCPVAVFPMSRCYIRASNRHGWTGCSWMNFGPFITSSILLFNLIQLVLDFWVWQQNNQSRLGQRLTMSVQSVRTGVSAGKVLWHIYDSCGGFPFLLVLVCGLVRRFATIRFAHGSKGFGS